MAGAHSCVLNQSSLMQIGQRFAHVDGKRVGIGVVFFGERVNDVVQCSSIAAGKDFVRSFVQFDDAFGVEQHAFAGDRIGLQSDAIR